MDLSSLLEWWDEWQLSVLALGSLGVKCFLAVAAGARRSHIAPVYRSLIWLCYLGGDALAIYALAALLNIQKKAAQESSAADDRGSRALQLLWAPIMLMHLGGLANISAYNIEDNELWRRHIATSVSQVAISVYVFCKMWSSSTADKRLLAAAILLFIPGVFKCFEKPLALWRSSFYNLVSKPTEQKNRGQKKSPAAAEPSLEDNIKDAKTDSAEPEIVDNLKSQVGSDCLEKLSRPDKLFVDLPRTYLERSCASKSFWHLKDGAAQEVIGTGISNTFNLLYTKDFTLDGKARKEHPLDLLCSFVTWIFCLLVPLAAIGLLHSGRKEAYRGSDVTITFVLLYATLLVDACSIFSLDGSPWHDMVTQHNLMELLDRNRRRPWVTAVAGHLGCTELLGHHLFFRMDPCGSLSQQGGGITSAVRHHVKDGWKEYIEDAESYTTFSDLRGQWTLQRKECDESLALDRPFDEAVLIWHLATDLCRSLLPHDNTDATLATQISNYMMHLLFTNPEMLMPGSRMYLCTAAYRGMETILHDEEEEQKKEKGAAVVADRLLGHRGAGCSRSELCTLAYQKVKAIFNKPPQDKESMVAARLLRFLKKHPELPAKTEENTAMISSEQEEGKHLVYSAWNLASTLHKFDEVAWGVVRGVWVEMLCFSAIRCRGYLHAKSLGSGGEYLTFVWLLMAHAGLETFPERQQRAARTRLPSDPSAAATKQADEDPAAAAADPSADRTN